MHNYINTTNRFLFHIRNRTIISIIRRSKVYNQTLLLQNIIDSSINTHLNESIEKVESGFVKNSRFFSVLYGLKNEHIKLISYMIILNRKDRVKYNHEANSLIKQVNELHYSILTVDGWRMLCDILNRNGLFVISGLIRNKAIERAYSEVYNNNYPTYLDVEDAFKAAVDQSDFQIAEKLLNKLDAMHFDKETLNDYFIYYYFLSGKKERAHSLVRSKYSKIDLEYSAYLKNKNIAIVAPTPMSEYTYHEIKSYDIVIHLNYKGQQQLAKSQLKTDVSYYSETLLKMDENEFSSHTSQLDFIVSPSCNYPLPHEKINSTSKRIMYPLLNQYFIGGPNLIQRILYDILFFEPRECKVFNANFFLSNDLYVPGYYPSGRTHPHYTAFGYHNPVSQLNFTRLLYESNMISVDNNCQDILKMPTYQYLESLESIFNDSLGIYMDFKLLK